MGRVEGKVALVTGAAGGLGQAIARLLAREGAKVVLTDIDEARAAALAGDIGDNALSLGHDVTSEEAWKTVLGKAVSRFGGLNILVNNAGIGPHGTIEDTSAEDWRRVHAVDLDSVFFGCKHAIRHIHESGGGSIVNISSIAGIVAGHNLVAYNSAKAAVRHLSKSIALYCAKQKYGIRCNSVHPTFVRTPILDPLVERFGPEEAYSKLARQVPLGRIGEPEEIANGVLFLASDESSFMTGAELILDGGISAM